MPVASANMDLHETLALLTSQLRPGANHKEDLVFLKDVFSEKSLGYLMKIHEKLKQYEKQSPSPVLHSASCLAEDLTEELQDGPLEEDGKELLVLLNTPHFKAVLSAHDTVAQKNFDPVLPPLPEDAEDELEEESVKIVRLVKNKEPLGATIRRDEATGAVVVARIMRGGAADRSGELCPFCWGGRSNQNFLSTGTHFLVVSACRTSLVHVGDELREVNGKLISRKRPDEISQILSQSQGSITLKIIPAVAEEDKMKESRVYLRALFDYAPSEDRAAPCQEAGLPFKRGDILQVVSREDSTWWQAKKVGDCNLRAALIPSAHFQERRLRYRQKTGSFPASASPHVTAHEQADRGMKNARDCRSARPTSFHACSSPFNRLCCGFTPPSSRPVSSSRSPRHADDVEAKDAAGPRRSFRPKRERRGWPAEPRAPDADGGEFPTYEEVALYLPRPGERPRLIVLLGSLGSGVAELKQKVIAGDPGLYGLAVPHTTRPRRTLEREGVEYHFVTKAAFEADIHNGKFIEYGEYKDNLYGTSLESIHRVLLQDKTCLVDVQPEALKVLRTAAFKPFVVFVRPSVLDGERKSPSSSSSLVSVALTEHDIQDMRQSAERLEQNYGHWLDYVLVKEEPPGAVAELQAVLERLRREPQWVPASWMQTTTRAHYNAVKVGHFGTCPVV
ncbi:MAGUK p55 subfamily member 3-like isoform X4 [Syngnathoides biaculeatus]|uniref:MAGUK p55 subfamily member 3-like isoform X4 n=1 Tax=Syngnathoides biaculeatus TaxID=300417 RepID=UPI002ADE35A6|nr:MAGUK p55 subfamily member 3-like isoform X4 [Syngnathoides biaculeatus]